MSKITNYILIAALLFLSPIMYGAEPPYIDVSVTDPKIVEISQFAAQTMGRGNLYQLFSAQEQKLDVAINYNLRLQVVDAHQRFHIYKAVVQVPADDTQDWELLYFVPDDR